MNEAEMTALERWRHGDQNAGQALFASLIPPLRRYFCRRTDRDVEELVQTTLLSLVSSSSGASRAPTLRAFALRCARNRLIDYRRAAGRRRVESLPETLVRLGTTPSQSVAKQEAAEAVRDCLESLSGPIRGVLELHYWDGLAVAEIAEVLEVPVGTVKSRLHQGRARFARIFERRYAELYRTL